LHARCGAGEKVEITSKPYLLLSSGQSQPSREDVEISKRLTETGKIVGISVLDHIIIGDGNFTSLKEKGVF